MIKTIAIAGHPHLPVRQRQSAKPRHPRNRKFPRAKPAVLSAALRRRSWLREAMIPVLSVIFAAVLVYGTAVKTHPHILGQILAQISVQAADAASENVAPTPREIQKPLNDGLPLVRAAAVKPQASETVLAPSPERATGFVQSIGDKATILAAGFGHAGDAQARDGIRDLIRQDFDLDRIGLFAIGPAWERATSAQQQEYRKLFAAWAIGNYARILDYLPRAQFSVLGAEPAGENGTLVRTRMEWTGYGSVDFGLLVSDVRGRLIITDVIIDRDVSVDLVRREDFASVILHHGIDGLIADLKQRVDSDWDKYRPAFVENGLDLSGTVGSIR
jgi:phospholipid transport system substrate-binding protein